MQPITAARALKAYRCPGCDRVIPIATAHLAVWRADGVLGDRSDLDARRHWHEHCWRIA
ncbi:Putative ATP/GTP-binding protein, doubtful CDS [Mycetocola reblochoni REB411]|uniref:Putative ATP/GTP-binding protein, doubtful CDS n=1 Tax=Mycetocola reblochoni REB411 TaxID=1255698 RepID=A0A1R4JC49_9MICO|nr:Putative ATP/GTP-binding protein, doubtful CDS [Mycetocola reblochoni REB411]